MGTIFRNPAIDKAIGILLLKRNGFGCLGEIRVKDNIPVSSGELWTRYWVSFLWFQRRKHEYRHSIDLLHRNTMMRFESRDFALCHKIPYRKIMHYPHAAIVIVI